MCCLLCDEGENKIAAMQMRSEITALAHIHLSISFITTSTLQNIRANDV